MVCDDGKKEFLFKFVEVIIYNSVFWDVLLVISDVDLFVGFNVWCLVCVWLVKDLVWGEFCVSVMMVVVDLMVVCVFFQEWMQVYSLCFFSNGDQGLIIGYYELVYYGSLSQGEKILVLVYGVLDDLVVVVLESVYLEFKGKCLCGCLEGWVLKFYDDVVIICDNGFSVLVFVWLGDLMDLQFLQIQGFGCIQLEDGW